MPRVCTVCQHIERAAIDDLLVNGGSNRNIAKQFSVSPAAVHRHKVSHLPATLAQAQEAAETARADDLLGQVRDLQAKALGILAKAEASGDLKAAVSAIREARGCVELLAKLTDQLREGITVNIAVNPQWLQIKAVILDTLKDHPDLRARLANRFRELNA
jgi:hypothetical protein